jgi:hypothetical protein
VRRDAPLVVRVPPIINEYEAAVRKLTVSGFANADPDDGTERKPNPKIMNMIVAIDFLNG